MRSAWFILLIGSVGCSGSSSPSSPTPASCVPGAVVACPCAGGAPGAQTCKSDGTFSECRCESVDAAVDTFVPDTFVPDALGDSSAVADTSAADTSDSSDAASSMCPSGACTLRVPIPAKTVPISTGSTDTMTICGGMPTGCYVEVDLAKPMWIYASPSGMLTASAPVPVRTGVLTLDYSSGAKATVTIGGPFTGCPADSWHSLPLYIGLAASGTPRPGCDVAPVTSFAGNRDGMRSAMRTCSGLGSLPGPGPIVDHVFLAIEAGIRDAIAKASCR